MKVLARLYRYLTHYKACALLAFGAMVVFAASMTIMIALAQPLFDIVLAPPGRQHVERTHLSREQAVRQSVVNTILRRGEPEGQRGWLVNSYDRGAKSFNDWWNGEPKKKARKVLIALLIVFIIRAFTS